VPVILDAKRGDIGSTAAQYAVEAFERYGADAVTLNPYMGRDSAAARSWPTTTAAACSSATPAIPARRIPGTAGRWRAAVPARRMPFLVPGVGAQGGDVEAVVRNGATPDGRGLVISSSRAILYASTGPGFADAARNAAQRQRDEINRYR
jgi:orotidine-5'-phosphate decarboxylase